MKFTCPECGYNWFYIDRTVTQRYQTNLMDKFPHEYHLTYPESWVHDNNNPETKYEARCSNCGKTWVDYRGLKYLRSYMLVWGALKDENTG